MGIDVGEGYIEINEIKSKGVQLWEDTCPGKVKVKCVSSERKLSVYNIFDVGVERGGIKSQVDTSGMLLEEYGDYKVYRCNNFGFETNFDRLEFSIKLL